MKIINNKKLILQQKFNQMPVLIRINELKKTIILIETKFKIFKHTKLKKKRKNQMLDN